MIDREKVIKGLEVCVNRVPGKYGCHKCPYEIDGNDCEINCTKDALALLKEQEQPKSVKEPLLCNNSPKAYKGICPWCNSVITLMYGQFCDMCGKAVKWEV